MAGFLGGSSSGGNGGEILFPAEFIDPVTKLRVSEPQTLIDTDFEYGLQPTKWETVELINNTPSFFSKSGDTTIPAITAIVTTTTSREIKVTTQTAHGLAVGIPINVSGTKSVTADGAYIINSIPDNFTFTYLAKEAQPTTASIFDLYTSIITGEFFQGSQIKISDSQGIVTDAASTSVLTVQTDSPHGFQVGTPFYFLNLNSTVSQQFDSSNTGAKTFDSSNSSTAQTFDGSNSLTSYNVDFDNRAYVGGTQSATVTHSTANKTITVLHTTENFSGKPIGTPLYYNAPATQGYFLTNPRGIVFLADSINNALGTSTSTFAVSSTPGGTPIDLPTAPTGFFQLANQAVTFAGNNIDTVNQSTLTVVSPVGREIDGANTLGSLSTVNTYSGTIIQLNNDAGTTISTGLYVGAMVFYTTTGTVATGLANNTTYWVTYYNEPAGASVPGFLQIKVSATVGGADITVSGGSGTQKFRKIGVSVDKNVWNLASHGYATGDLVRYTYPAGGKVGIQSYTKDHAFVTKLDNHNFYLNDELGIDATGGTISTINVSGINYKVHRFVVDTQLTSKTISFTVNSGNGTAEFLVVGGGGAGGPYVGGGGGAGTFIEGTFALTGGTTYTVVVGAGGNRGGAPRDDTWTSGSASSISGGGVNIVAPGGGKGGRYAGENGYNGGSGGGAGGCEGLAGIGGTVATAATITGVISGTAYANRGGNNTGSRPNADTEGRGGGGAGAQGQDKPTSDASDGGIGRQSSISGTSYYYAAGGGGGGYYPASAGADGRGGNGGLGGSGGGGAHANGSAGQPGSGGETAGEVGSTAGEGPGGNAGIHTGSGGGGCGHSERGGNGGSGIVYIRYQA